MSVTLKRFMQEGIEVIKQGWKKGWKEWRSEVMERAMEEVLGKLPGRLIGRLIRLLKRRFDRSWKGWNNSQEKWVGKEVESIMERRMGAGYDDHLHPLLAENLSLMIRAESLQEEGTNGERSYPWREICEAELKKIGLGYWYIWVSTENQKSPLTGDKIKTVLCTQVISI
jgi:hypothetical protein